MRRRLILAPIMVVAGLAAFTDAASAARDDLVLVKGGKFRNTRSNYHLKGVVVADFYIGRYEVTQRQWMEVMGGNPSRFRGEDRPVEMVSWYDAVEYCNKRSLKEGLEPYYHIQKGRKDPNNRPDPKFGDLDEVKWTVTINAGAGGYRLPTEAEWEYAAGGGRLSRSYTYSGSDNVDEVAWYWRNCGDRDLSGAWSWPLIQQNHDQPKPVGRKKPNELGLYDMSGNVREWCWDWYGDLPTGVTNPVGANAGFRRVWRGGGWMGADFCCASSYRGGLAANGKGPDQGFRVCRGKKPGARQARDF
jgi:formylglycine-generating enzyme required for sulfatase activity